MCPTPSDNPAVPWNDWYHCMWHTYGTWLPGDPKGFRTRHHRQHVEGDYRNPPPRGMYDDVWKRSKQLMKRAPVSLSLPQRKRAMDEVLKSLEKWKVEVVAISVDAVHVHLLARFRSHNPRRYLGLAKKECSAYMKQEALAPEGGLWAVRTKSLPIRDRAHQISVARYIIKHRAKGAVVWFISSTRV